MLIEFSPKYRKKPQKNKGQRQTTDQQSRQETPTVPKESRPSITKTAQTQRSSRRDLEHIYR